MGPGPGGPARDFEDQDGPTGQAGRGQRQAGQARPERDQAVDRPAPRQAGPLMKALDVNGDGVLNAREIANAAKALAKLDKNDDGKITRDEVRPLAPRRGAGANAEGPRGLRARDGQGPRAGQDAERPGRRGDGQAMGPGPMGPRGQANGEGFQPRRGEQRGQATGPRGQRLAPPVELDEED
jgi:hypothetical protein